MGVLGMESPIFEELCSSRSPKSHESAPVLKIFSFQKRARYQRGGCPDTLDTPWIRPTPGKQNITVKLSANDYKANLANADREE